MNEKETRTELVAIVASLRAGSFNRAVFRTAQQVLPAGVVLTEAPIADVPLYNADIEAAGDPPSVAALKTKISEAHGLLFFTPEYNRSVPAVAKNALDWASRVPGDSAIGDVPVGIVATAPGPREAEGLRAALTHAINGARANAFENSMCISSIVSKIEDGMLVDADAKARLAEYLIEFTQFVRESVAIDTVEA